MALIPCPACGRQVSTAAPTCAGCGHPIAGANNADLAGKAIGGIAAWLVAPWIARGIFAAVAVIALFAFLTTL